MGKLTNTVNFLILSNVIFFVFSELSGHGSLNFLGLYFPKNDSFGVWQFITHMFMHDNTPHILFNMMALWLFGTPLERVWGSHKFLIFYFIAGIGAAGIYTLINYYNFDQAYGQLTSTGLPSADVQQLLSTGIYASFLTPYSETISILFDTYSAPLVGASGAIYGVMVAYAITFPNIKWPFIFPQYYIMPKYFIPIIIALNLFSGLTGIDLFGKNVAHFSHIGGAIIGLLLMVFWKRKLFRLSTLVR